MERQFGMPPPVEGEQSEIFVPPEEIVVDELLLRRLKPEEAPRLVQVISDNADYIGKYETWVAGVNEFNERTALARNEIEVQKGIRASYGIFLDDELVGNVVLRKIEGTPYALLGYWRADNENLRGKLIVTRAAAALVKMGLEDMGVEAVLIEINEENAASHRVAARLGASITSVDAVNNSIIYTVTDLPRDEDRL